MSIEKENQSMSKRHSNLFEKCFTYDSLYQAYLLARRGKRNTKGVQEFEKDLGFNLKKLHDELHSNTYQITPYRHFFVYEPKKRLISAPSFRDRIVQHAIYSIIYPIFDSSFIHDSYGCRKTKGTHKASDRLQEFMRRSTRDSYTLQLDIRKFYYSIDRFILKTQLERKIKDDRLVLLIMDFCKTNDTVGLPIGNLLSQLCALIYLNDLDHYIKRDLKVKFYVRYVDDFILVNLSKEQCINYKNFIEKYLDKNLNLKLSKSRIAPIKKGVNFVGYRTWRSKRFIRKRSLYNFTRNLKKNKIDSCISILGHSLNTSSFKDLSRKILYKYFHLGTQL